MTAQPLAVVIGQLEEISEAFVCVDNIKYKVSTPLKAIDTCFKIIIALNAEYPRECDPVWTFIQKYIYEITTEGDRSYVCVSTLISDLKRLD